MIYKVHHLHCGSMCPFCAPLFGQKGLVAEMVCHCLLLETDQGLVLIDTGLGLQDYLYAEERLGKFITRFGTIQQDLNLSALGQIKKLGFKAADVKHIIVTSLDFDHAGGISDFPQAMVHVLSSEYNATQHFGLKNQYRYRKEQIAKHRHWNFVEPEFGESWFNLNKVQGFKIFQDEILLIPLLGHSEGHCGIAIKQKEHWLLFCGDAYYSHQQLDPHHKLRSLGMTERVFAYDNVQRIRSLQQIQLLSSQHPEIEIMCAHDPVEMRRYIQ